MGFLRKIVLSALLFCCFTLNEGIAQNPQFFNQLFQKETRSFTMPDGAKLSTDIYLPVPKQDIKAPVNIPNVNVDSIVIFPKGEQYLVYDSVNGWPNPNPRQLPIIFKRTPYDKFTEQGMAALTFLGYAVAVQDTRGRYASEGVYYPFISNGWKTAPYHPQFNHVLDSRSPQNPENSNFYSDGANSIRYILDSLKREIDVNRDGQTDKITGLSNGSIGMLGSSASGYNQYRASASMKPAGPDSPGLKCILPVAATGEFHQSAGFHNFVYRKGLVEGWLNRMFDMGFENSPDSIAKDLSMNNDLHTPADYPFQTRDSIANAAIDHTVSYNYSGTKSGFYPNSAIRKEMDISRATLNQQGQADPNGTVSRYTNLDQPVYHLTGWWDIFINGQIETFENIDRHTDQQKNLMVIGPWTHQTIGGMQAGDLTFPSNVQSLLSGTDLDSQGVGELFNSELFLWLRNNLNQNRYKKVGEPKFVMRKQKDWKSNGNIEYKAPSEDYYIPYKKMILFLAGKSDLKNFPVKVRFPFGSPVNQTITIPAQNVPGFENIDVGDPHKPFNKDFQSLPKVRFYVVGPDNGSAGNYWFRADSFPPKNAGIRFENIYWQGGKELGIDSIDNTTSDSFVHDPLDPVLTVGGNNMVVRTPDDQRLSQGPMNLQDYSQETLPGEHVLEWESKEIEDSLSIIGKPRMSLHFKTQYENPGIQDQMTNTQFFVRVLDVYPDGREILVTEGAINAYARRYTKKLVEKPSLENEIPFSIDTTSFSNIQTGEKYRLQFHLLPIAYTFGDGHKLKIVISSSNYPKYQVDPGLPMKSGTFFRWNPVNGFIGDHPTGNTQPRKLLQTILSGKDQQTYLSLPVYGKSLKPQSTTNVAERKGVKVEVYPNPASDFIYVKTGLNQNVEACLLTMQGQREICKNAEPSFRLNVQSIKPGVYFLEFRKETDLITTQKVVIVR